MYHSSAIIDPSAKLADDVQVGPWSIIGAGVEIDSGTEIGSHVVIKGPTKIGKNNHIYQFASVGEDCQDKKYAGELTRLEIGDNNIIREGVTIHRGTTQDQGVTRIGNDNLLMAYAHVAHDVVLGDHIILANNTALAGHVHVSDWAILGGFTAVHQFCHIGAHAMSGAGTLVLKDIPSYVMTNGNPAAARGINTEGLKRRGFSPEQILFLRRAYKIIYRQDLTTEQAVIELSKQKEHAEVLTPLIESLKNSPRGIIR